MDNFAPSMPPDFRVNGMPGAAEFGGAGGSNVVFPRFYMASKYMPALSQQEGKPIAKPLEMVEIRQAGERDTMIEEVNDQHRYRWPQQYAAFKAGQSQIQAGTPLGMLFLANPEVVEELKRGNVHTIEALLEVPDSAINAIPFLTEWKKRAKLYLDGTAKGKGFHVLERALDAEKAKTAALEERLAALEEKQK